MMVKGDVPESVVTLTSTVSTPGGEVAVIEVSLFTLKSLERMAPKRTSLTLVKLVPVIVTFVPPTTGPFLGKMLVIVGPGGGTGGIVIACVVVALGPPLTLMVWPVKICEVDVPLEFVTVKVTV